PPNRSRPRVPRKHPLAPAPTAPESDLHDRKGEFGAQNRSTGPCTAGAGTSGPGSVEAGYRETPLRSARRAIALVHVSHRRALELRGAERSPTPAGHAPKTPRAAPFRTPPLDVRWYLERIRPCGRSQPAGPSARG